MDLLFNQPVVIDNGSGTIKAGYAGESIPQCSFPAYVGRPKHARIMAGAIEGDEFIGQDAEEVRGLLKLRYPIEHGCVLDWDDMERIWAHVYSRQLKTSPDAHPVLLTEPALNPRAHRDGAAQVLFETFNVPSFYSSIQAVLSLYASGRTTGIVLDSGDGVTHAVPIYEGFSVPSAIQRVDLAGRDITDHLQLLLRKSGWAFQTSAEREIVRHIKETRCHFALDPEKEEKDWHVGMKAETYMLPDGHAVHLGPERFRAMEILFDPEIVGSEYAGVHRLLVNAIQRTDMDLRRQLYQTIVLSGGTTLARGFGARLLAETRKIAQKDLKIKIYAPPERKYSAWVGGSILAGLSTFKKMWITAAEYQEDPEIIHRRCN